ncbi:hypothetical protein ABPG77_008839 [Micractinium sp. CCAP 211/92]
MLAGSRPQSCTADERRTACKEQHSGWKSAAHVQLRHPAACMCRIGAFLELAHCRFVDVSAVPASAKRTRAMLPCSASHPTPGGVLRLTPPRAGSQLKWRPRHVRQPGRHQAAAAAASEQGDSSKQPGPQLDRAQEQRLRLQYERGHCYGCGARLQVQDPEVAGYVDRARYETKQRHRQLGQLLCHRCQELSNGAMIPAVADFAQREAPAAPAAAAVRQSRARRAAPAPALAAAVTVQHAEAAMAQQGQAEAAESRRARRPTGFTDKVLLTPEELRQKLKVVQQQKALVVLLVDLLDASGSIMGRVRDLVGNNPIMLIGTKVDLLPPGINPAEVAEWLKAAAAFKRISAVSVHLVSAKSGAGVPAAVAAIRRERRGRDVFVMGAANVGKSAFIRSLVRDMSKMSSRQFDPLALSRGRFLPVESAMPGTTLELIPMEVFASGGMLYDTPGLHLHHRVPHLLTPQENKQLHPRRKIRPYVPPSPSELLEATTAACSMPGGAGGAAGPADAPPAGGTCNVATYFWGGLVKLQVLGCPPDTELVFYGPQALLVEAAVEPAAAPEPASDGCEGPDFACSSSDGEDEAGGAAAAGGLSEEPHGFGAASVMRRGGLRPAKELRLKCVGGDGARRPVADVAVSGIPGWIAVYASGSRADSVHVRVWTPPGVEVFSRPPLPVPCPLADPRSDQTWLTASAAQQASAAVADGEQQQRQPQQQPQPQPGPVEDWW